MENHIKEGFIKMLEETKIEVPVVNEAQVSYEKYARKCFELGQAVYKEYRIDKDLEIAKSNLLVDVDKLAKEHDKLIAAQQKKTEAVKPEVLPEATA